MNNYLEELKQVPIELGFTGRPEYKRYRLDYLNLSDFRDYREKLVIKYSWAIPSEEALEAIGDFTDRIVEIGAGTGYWSWLLSNRGTNCLCYDEAPPTLNVKNGWKHNTEYHPIHYGNQIKAAQHPDRTLFLCWPPHSDDLAYEALCYYRGDKVIYIGESDGGCNAEEKFFDKLENEWYLVRTVDLPNWNGIHDDLSFWKRRDQWKTSKLKIY